VAQLTIPASLCANDACDGRDAPTSDPAGLNPLHVTVLIPTEPTHLDAHRPTANDMQRSLVCHLWWRARGTRVIHEHRKFLKELLGPDQGISWETCVASQSFQDLTQGELLEMFNFRELPLADITGPRQLFLCYRIASPPLGQRMQFQNRLGWSASLSWHGHQHKSFFLCEQIIYSLDKYSNKEYLVCL
jgi:hypothetical protein